MSNIFVSSELSQLSSNFPALLAVNEKNLVSHNMEAKEVNCFYLYLDTRGQN